MIILDANKKYMFPDEENMGKWYDEFNHRFFEGKLEPIGLSVEHRLPKRIHGFFHSPSQNSSPGFQPEECSISLNGRYFDSEDRWRTVFLHEMVHYVVYKQSDGKVSGHGKEFKRIAARINKNSEFRIETHIDGRSFQPKWKEIENWEQQRQRDFIIGHFVQTRVEDYIDEDTNEVIKIDCLSSSATFKTTRAYMSEITDNLSSVRGSVTWFEVTACCQKLALIRRVNYTPDYREEYLCNHGWFEDEIKDGIMINDEYGPVGEFGPIECRLLGTTDFIDGRIEGYVGEKLRSSFREQYFKDSEEIGKLAAEKLVSLYHRTPQWYKTSHHGTYEMKPSNGDYSIEMDSRFIALAAMTPKKIQINPVRSDTMMDYVRKGDSESLAREITEVIKSRQRN